MSLLVPGSLNSPGTAVSTGMPLPTGNLYSLSSASLVTHGWPLLDNPIPLHLTFTPSVHTFFITPLLSDPCDFPLAPAANPGPLAAQQSSQACLFSTHTQATPSRML